MIIRLIDNKWGEEFENISLSPNESLRIICPFIKLQALKRLLINVDSENIEIITRFNLADFANRVSDISALRHLLKIGANVRGIKGLHTKLYMFGQNKTVLTSANLTKAAMTKNSEFGFLSNDTTIAAQCHTYFDKLWSQSRSELNVAMLDEWQEELRNHLSKGVRKNHENSLPDYGDAIEETETPLVSGGLLTEYDGPDYFQAFVKFLGEGHNRSPTSNSILDEVINSGCHWALGYPNTQRPRQVEDGATMFIARLTYNPNDIKIFGRATALSHDEGRDNATVREIDDRPWKGTWGRYIRVYDAEFISGTLENGVSLNKLMESLEAKSFAPSKRNFERGSGNFNPRLSYKQKPSVELSEEGFLWLNGMFESALTTFGSIPESELSKLDWPDFESKKESPTFRLKLGKTYFNKGYFNPPAELAEEIAGGAVNLLLGADRKIIQAMSQVYETNDYVPRVFGYAPLRNWFSRNYKEGDEITVSIESKNQFWLR